MFYRKFTNSIKGEIRLTINLSKEKPTHMYKRMLEIRFFEEKVFKLYVQNLVLAQSRLTSS